MLFLGFYVEIEGDVDSGLSAEVLANAYEYIPFKLSLSLYRGLSPPADVRPALTDNAPRDGEDEDDTLNLVPESGRSTTRAHDRVGGGSESGPRGGGASGMAYLGGRQSAK